MEGKVKWFSRNKGYGFIEAETEGDIFVHYSSIEGEGYRVLKQGEAVTFELVDSPKGPQAFNVKKSESEEVPEDQELAETTLN